MPLKARLRPAALKPALRAAHHVAYCVLGDHRVVRLSYQQKVAVTAIRVEVVSGKGRHPLQRRRAPAAQVDQVEAVVE